MKLVELALFGCGFGFVCALDFSLSATRTPANFIEAIHAVASRKKIDAGKKHVFRLFEELIVHKCRRLNWGIIMHNRFRNLERAGKCADK